jgi:outer membrane protein assembly factor BamB
MSQDYSSPVVAGDKMYFARRGGEVFVFKLGREFEQLAVNKFPGEADYSATPAIADGQIFIRSSKKLYCVARE